MLRILTKVIISFEILPTIISTRIHMCTPSEAETAASTLVSTIVLILIILDERRTVCLNIHFAKLS